VWGGRRVGGGGGGAGPRRPHARLDATARGAGGFGSTGGFAPAP
jgi:hypothetical protein